MRPYPCPKKDLSVTGGRKIKDYTVPGSADERKKRTDAGEDCVCPARNRRK